MQSALHYFVVFFSDKDAFTLGGVVRLLGQLLTMMGAAIGLRLIMKAPKVTLSTVEPLGLFDVNQYEESFGLRGIPLRAEIQAALVRLIHAAGGSTPAAGEKPLHWILTWDASTPASVRRPPKTFKGEPMSFPVSPEERLVWAKMMLSVAPRPSVFGFPDTPVRFLFPGSTDGLSDFTGLVRPTDARSRYADKQNWEGQTQFPRIAGQNALTEAIETSGADPTACAIALEQVHSARWFINFIEVENKSDHAAASAVRVAIDHSGNGEAFLLPGGSLDLQALGQFYSTTGRNLLPGERRWAVLRSRRPIDPSQFSVLVDPTPFFYPAYARVVFILMGFIAFLWLVSNVLLRLG